MPSKNSNRLGRIDEELKKEISNIINYDLKNPNITGLLSVTKVNTTPDLKYAKVYVSILKSKNTQHTFLNLKKSAGFVRTEVAKRVNLRITPEIVFVLDDSMEYGEKINHLINEIMLRQD